MDHSEIGKPEKLEDLIVSLHNEGKWREVTEIRVTGELRPEKRRFFWVLPAAEDLDWITDNLRKIGVLGVTSVGCGCGLVEWLIQEHSGLEVIGIELDDSWWTSRYSPPTFLRDIRFRKPGGDYRDLNLPSDFALLFCYFNDGSAFVEYMQRYGGNAVLVIGPKDWERRHTDPLPFDDKFRRLGWTLHSYRKFRNSEDLVVIYVR